MSSILHFCGMLSSRPFSYLAIGPRPNVAWSCRGRLSRLRTVDGRWDSDSDADRAAFRRALGVTLSRVRRELTTYSQDRIAQELGVNVETVGRWERGEREPKTFELHRLAVKYDAPGEWFMFPTDSLSELDRRIERLRIERLARAAGAAAQEDAAAAGDLPDDDEGEFPLGRRSA